MAHGLNSVVKRGVVAANACKTEAKQGIGSRRIFAPHFKLQVLDSYRNDADCKGNQRATARKYGIHRRQIQKWLQAENALRSTVTAKQQQQQHSVALSSGRQLDAAVSGATAGAAATPLPLDFTTRSAGPPSPPDPSAPMDLSLKRPSVETPSRAPACYAPVPSPPAPLAASPRLEPQPDVWDLSTKGVKRRSPSPPLHTSPKPVKLFKPYLMDDLKESESSSSPPTVVKLEPLAPCCSSNCDAYYYHNNNNNNVCEIKSEYGGSAYTLHELQPKSAMGYYYSSYPGYEYDVVGGYVYEDISYGQRGAAPLKQRQSYSLDFKLSAIDCYYQDTACKGNQRAVATKYNIHRRQIQKWLKQAEELRLRNESSKQGVR